MKKIYIMPSMLTKEIKINSILAGSETVTVNSSATVGEGGYGGPQAKESTDFEDEEPAKAWGSIW